MLKKILFLLFSGTLFCGLSLAQDKKYFDASGKSTNEQNAYYYRVKENGNYYKSYYKSTNTVYFEGEIVSASDVDESLNKYKGICKWYYKNGNLQKTRTYDENSVLNGNASDYYENGSIKTKYVYTNGKLKDNVYYEYTLEGDEIAVFKENFNDANNGWDIYSSDKSRARIQNQTLEIESLTKEGTSRYISVFKTNTPFSIEADIDYAFMPEKEKGGLIFGFNDWNNFVYFLMDNASGMYIGIVKDGMLIEKASGMYCSSFKSKDKNQLKVYQKGEKIYFSVNGEIQFSVPLFEFSGLNIGFAISGKSKLMVKNLLYRYATSNYSTNDISKEDKNVKATGTGFLISDNGYLITNEHVVSGANKIFVENNGKTYKAEIVAKDKDNDVAILKIKDSSFKNVTIPYVIKDNFNSNLASYVFTVGYPLALAGMGKEPKFADGKVSAKTGYEGSLNSFQTSIPVQPGNSGSPVFNEQGEVIGIINAKYKEGDNVSYAIKSSFIKNLIESLPEPLQLNTTNTLQNMDIENKTKKIINYIYLIKVQ